MYDPIILTQKSKDALIKDALIKTNKFDEFCYYQHIGNTRTRQEDTLSFQRLKPTDLISEDGTSPLVSDRLRERLWTTFVKLSNTEFSKGGSTAISCLYGGDGNLYIECVGDSSMFALFVDSETNEFLDVTRLNSIMHKPNEPHELARILASGGQVVKGRLNGKLAISRAFGDDELKPFGLCADPTIDVVHVTELLKKLKITRDANKVEVWILAASDGFTDGAGMKHQARVCQENYIRTKLTLLFATYDNLSPLDVVEKLSLEAMMDGSRDNITLAIQKVTLDTSPFWLSIFDGHSGNLVSNFLAEHALPEFKRQCLMSTQKYNAQPESAARNKERFNRDNSAQSLCSTRRRSSYTLMTAVLGRDKNFENDIKTAMPLSDQRQTLKVPQNKIVQKAELGARNCSPNPGFVLKGFVTPAEYVRMSKEKQTILYTYPHNVRQLMVVCQIVVTHLKDLSHTLLEKLCKESHNIEFLVSQTKASFESILKLWKPECEKKRTLIFNSKEVLQLVLTECGNNFEKLIELQLTGIENLIKTAQESSSCVQVDVDSLLSNTSISCGNG